MNEHHHKMYQYEVTPPARCWEKIASDLDASDMAYQYPSRMREYGITPPANAWENISNALPGNNKTLSFGRRSTPFFRYAAAAVILGLLAWGGIQLLSTDKEQGTDLANTNQDKIQPTKKSTTPGTEVNNSGNNLPVPEVVTENAVAEARDNAALEASKKTYASIDVPNRSKIRNVSDFFFAPDATMMGNTRGLNFDEPEETDPNDVPSGDRYFTLMTPEGNIIRMSKKWGDLVCCVSGEEQDDDCLEQMKKWRQQLASPSHGHATGSFMDILGLLKTLQNDEL